MLKLLFLAVFITADALPQGLLPPPGAPPGPPPGGIFPGGNIENQENSDAIKDAALQACTNLLQQEFGICPPGSRSCDTRITQVENFRTQTVAGINYILDLTADYDGREFVCRDVTIFEPLPFNCDRGLCLESIREDKVSVQEVFSPSPCAGCASEANINDQPNKRRIKNAALRHCTRLLQIEYGICPPGSPSCDGEISKVDNFKTQVVSGTNYIMDLTVTFDGDDYICRDLTLYESFSCKRASCMESINEESVQLITVRRPDPPGPPPCAGCPSEANINDQPNRRRIKNAALRDCTRLLQIEYGICPPGSPSCDGEITKVDNFKTQVVSGTNYIMDLTVSFDGIEYICRELTLYESFNCNRASCIESINEESVRLDPPPFCAGCPSEPNIPIDDLENADDLKFQGLKACERIVIERFGLRRTCNFELDEVENYTTQLVAGTNHIVDLRVSTNCGRKSYICKEITLYEPFDCSSLSCIESSFEENVRLEEL